MAVIDRMFSGEEFLGRYLDLVSLHERHSNLGHGIKRLSYLTYLDEFDSFDKIPRAAKSDMYAKYIQALLEYLKLFYRRAFPLKDLDTELQTAVDEFVKKWEKGQVDGWSEAKTNGALQETEGIWCHACGFNQRGSPVKILRPLLVPQASAHMPNKLSTTLT